MLKHMERPGRDVSWSFEGGWKILLKWQNKLERFLKADHDAFDRTCNYYVNYKLRLGPSKNKREGGTSCSVRKARRK